MRDAVSNVYERNHPRPLEFVISNAQIPPYSFKLPIIPLERSGEQIIEDEKRKEQVRRENAYLSNLLRTLGTKIYASLVHFINREEKEINWDRIFYGNYSIEQKKNKTVITITDQKQ